MEPIQNKRTIVVQVTDFLLFRSVIVPAIARTCKVPGGKSDEEDS